MNCFFFFNVCVFFCSPALVSKVCPPRVHISLKALKPCFIACLLACLQVHGETCLSPKKIQTLESHFSWPTATFSRPNIKSLGSNSHYDARHIHPCIHDYYNFRLIGHIHPCA